MIDIENKVFDTVKTAVTSAFATDYPTLTMYSEYVLSPTSFPCVTLIETDNYTQRRTQTEQPLENYAEVVFEANIYTNNIEGRKSLAKAIADVVDVTMQNMMFTRTLRTQTPNVDTTIYRLTLRYRAVVSAPVEDANGNRTYTMYRYDR